MKIDDIDEATQEEWNSLQPLADELFQASRTSHYAHNEQAKVSNRRNKSLALFAALLAGISGATILSRVSEFPPFAHYKLLVELIQGVIALAAASLSTIQMDCTL